MTKLCCLLCPWQIHYHPEVQTFRHFKNILSSRLLIQNSLEHEKSLLTYVADRRRKGTGKALPRARARVKFSHITTPPQFLSPSNAFHTGKSARWKTKSTSVGWLCVWCTCPFHRDATEKSVPCYSRPIKCLYKIWWSKQGVLWIMWKWWIGFWGRILNKDTQLFNHGQRYTYG